MEPARRMLPLDGRLGTGDRVRFFVGCSIFVLFINFISVYDK